VQDWGLLPFKYHFYCLTNFTMKRSTTGWRNFSAIMPLLLIGVFPQILLSQPEVPVTPRIMITETGHQRHQPMKLQNLDVDIRIMGQIAVTTIEMVWYNSNPVVLEGSFEFPLAEGQSVSGFALDIAGRMRKGVIVEKEKGRRVFEAIVRRNVDPGLLEATAGNNYRARIYPLPPKGTRTIRITIEQELTAGKDDDLYTLPLKIRDQVASFSLRIEVMKRQVSSLESEGVMRGIIFRQEESSMVASLTKQNFIPDSSISLLLPARSGIAPEVAVSSPTAVGGNRIREIWLPVALAVAGLAIAVMLFLRRRRPLAGVVITASLVVSLVLLFLILNSPEGQPAERVAEHDPDYQYWTAASGKSDSTWFYLSINPYQPIRVENQPKHLTLLWDVSGSGDGRDHERERSLLLSLMKQYQTLKVTLVPFHIHREQPQHFMIKDGNVDALIESIDALAYDGASAAPDPQWIAAECDEVILFSDGIFNYRDTKLEEFNVPVHAVCASSIADHALLQRLTIGTGGAYINLMETNREDALERLTHRVWRLISAEVVDGTALSLYPSGSTPVNHRLTMAGIMQGDALSLRLHFGFGSRIEHSEQLTIKPSDDHHPIMLQRIWAGKMLQELLRNPESNRSQIVSLSKKYDFITPFTSLIVLEELSDYLQYKITPPPELSEDFRAAYFRQLQVNESAEADRVQGRIDRLVVEMEAQTTWWNTHFQPEPIPEQAENQDQTPEVELDAPPQAVAPAGAATGTEMVVQQPGDTLAINSGSEIFAGGFSNVWQYAVPYQINTIGASLTATVSLNTYNVTQQGNFAATQQGEEPLYSSSSIELKPWNPDAPYLKKLRKVPIGEQYKLYLKLKKTYHSTPAFFHDVSEHFRQQHQDNLSTRVVSNLAEVGLESPELLRTLGYKLMEYGEHRDAVFIFRKLLSLKGEDQRSLRDLGLALEADGRYSEAVKTLYRVITGEDDHRCIDLNIIVMNDINKILAAHPGSAHGNIDKRLIRREPVDIRVVLTWDLDDTDMDLWVTDPRGETCMYSNRLTAAGGKITRDVTQGYGPEEFMIRNAVPGTYTVMAHWYGSSVQGVLMPSNLHLRFYTHHGKRTGKYKEVTIRLEEQNEELLVGSFDFRK
jgi:hypothetical protein